MSSKVYGGVKINEKTVSKLLVEYEKNQYKGSE